MDFQDFLGAWIKRAIREKGGMGSGTPVRLPKGAQEEGPSPTLPSAILGRRARSPEEIYQRLMYGVSRFSARFSNLIIYYALLTPHPWILLSELMLRITKKRAAGLGRKALRACEGLKGGSDRRATIIDAVRDFEAVWLVRHSVRLPQECAERYADLFITGYRKVLATVGDVWAT